jgi:hypothetical protein
MDVLFQLRRGGEFSLPFFCCQASSPFSGAMLLLWPCRLALSSIVLGTMLLHAGIVRLTCCPTAFRLVNVFIAQAAGMIIFEILVSD